VSAKKTTATLTELNKQIAVDQMDIAAVAKAWLKSVGLVS
jgi:glycine betaine/choline ABC-type transport system substrate-binding protein